MHYATTIFAALAATAVALPNALPPTKRSPQFSFPTFPSFPNFPVGGGGSTGGGSTGSSSSTANDVTNKAPCGAVTVIFARGTGETGNIGSVIGPELETALKNKIGAANVNYQGVPYAADAAVSLCLFLI